MDSHHKLQANPENINQISPEVVSFSQPKVGNSKLILFGILIVIIIAGLVGAGYFLGAKRSTTFVSDSKINKVATPTPDPTASWNSYTDPDKRFSFKYPSDWQTVVVSKSNNVVVTTPDIAAQIKAHAPGEWTCPPFYPILITDVTDVPQFQSPPPGNNFTKTPVTIDGVASTLYTVNNTNSEATKPCQFIGEKSAFITIHKGNHVFRAELSDASNTKYMTVLNQLLTTFHVGRTTPTPVPLSTYTDPYLGYSIAYPKTWAFRRTYGPGVEKLAPTDIVSGFDITYNMYVGATPYTQATIVVNVLDAHDLTDIQTWIDTYDLNYPKSANKTLTTFHNIPALRFTNTSVSLGAAEYIYFISGKYAYRISIAQKGAISDDTRDIANSLQP